MIRKVFQIVKRVIWLLIIGSMIAFDNTYKQELKPIDQIEIVMNEDEEE